MTTPEQPNLNPEGNPEQERPLIRIRISPLEDIPQKPDLETNKSENGDDIPVPNEEQNIDDLVEAFSDEDKESYAKIVQNFEDQNSNNTEDSLYEEIKEIATLSHDKIYQFYMEHEDELTRKDKTYLNVVTSIKKGCVKNENGSEEELDDPEAIEKEKNKVNYDKNTRVICNDKIKSSEEKTPASDLSLTKEFIAEVDDKLSRGEDISEFVSRHIKEFFTKNGLPEEKIEKMTDQEATDVLREKIKEADRQNLPESEKEKEAKIQSALEQGKDNIEQEAEKAGVLDKVRKIGELYNKVPLKYKFLIGAALGIGSVALSGTVAAGCTLCLFSQRVLGGAGTFVMIEGLLQRAAEKGGRERTKGEKRRHAVEAAILGVAVGSRGINLLNDYFSPVDPSAIPLENTATEVGQNAPITPPDAPPAFTETPYDTPPTPETTDSLDAPALDEGDSLSEIFNGSNEAAASGVIETPAAEIDLSFTVGEETGTLWGGIEKTLQDQGYFNGLDEGRQTFLIDGIKDKFATMSPEELREIGISSGDISLVHSGETIDLSSVLEDTASVDKLAEQARELPDSVSNRIVENNEIIARWAHEHPYEALTDNKIGEIIQNAPEQVANSVSQENAEKVANSIPDTQTTVPEAGTTDSMPVGVEDQSASVETNIPSTENTPDAPIPESQPYVIQAMSEDLDKLYGNLETDLNIPVEQSAHWIGENGLSEQTIKTVMDTNPNLLDPEGIGIESSDAVSATQEHIEHLIEESGLSLQQNETVKEFFERAHDEIYYHKIMS